MEKGQWGWKVRSKEMVIRDRITIATGMDIKDWGGAYPTLAYAHGSTLPATPTHPQLVLVYLKVSCGDKKEKVGQPALQYVLQSSTDGIRYV